MSSGKSHSSFLFLASLLGRFLFDRFALVAEGRDIDVRVAGAKSAFEEVAEVAGEVKSMVKGALAVLAVLVLVVAAGSDIQLCSVVRPI
jgi:hypothetical protein